MTEPTQALSALQSNRLEMEVNEALYALRAAILAKADHELARVNQALREAGVELGAAGVRDLAMLYRTRRQALIDEMRKALADDQKRPSRYKQNDTDFQVGFDLGIEYLIKILEDKEDA